MMDVVTHEWQIKTANIRGLKSAWIEAGPEGADLLIFLHGYPDTPECWEHQIRFFSTRYRVIAPFMRGVGESDPGDSVRRYGTVPVTLDLLEIINIVDPGQKQRIFCVGHDLGSVYAWNLAASLSDRASGLVIINGLSIGQMLKRWRYPEQLRKSWYIYLMQLPLLPEAIVRLMPGKILKLAHHLGGLEESKRPDSAKTKSALRHPLNQYRSFFREIPRAIANPVTKVQCSVLVLWGSEDAFLMPPRLDELKADAEKVTVRILAGGHWLQRQVPDNVNDLINRFFGDQHYERKLAAKERVENNIATGR
jgi:pimeloyl-ACP methyl ester carboxylesterase